MEKLKEEIKELKKYKKILAYFILIGTLGYFSYLFYLIFNPKTDEAYEAKVIEEITAVDLNFDKKTIIKIKKSNVTGKEIEAVKNGKNPFQTY